MEVFTVYWIKLEICLEISCWNTQEFLVLFGTLCLRPPRLCYLSLSPFLVYLFTFAQHTNTHTHTSTEWFSTTTLSLRRAKMKRSYPYQVSQCSCHPHTRDCPPHQWQECIRTGDLSKITHSYSSRLFLCALANGLWHCFKCIPYIDLLSPLPAYLPLIPTHSSPPPPHSPHMHRYFYICFKNRLQPDWTGG